MSEGIIRKALSGFYYVDDGTELVTCRARGKHRHAGLTPLVGDRVRFTSLEGGQGALDEILPRKNEFYRPAVANIDLLVVVASQAPPVTDPFLIDRVTALAAGREKGSRLPLSVPRPRRLHAHRLSEGVQGAGYSRWAKASATVLTP